MKSVRSSFGKRVAGGRLTSSAQPPRAPSPAAQRPSLPPTPRPLRSTFFLDEPGALLEGLRRFTAFRPLSLLVEAPEDTRTALTCNRVRLEDLPSESSFQSEVCR
jgi:hypothetical protein